MEIQHVGVALGGEMGVASYHFSFQSYYMKCVFSVHPVLNAPEIWLVHSIVHFISQFHSSFHRLDTPLDIGLYKWNTHNYLLQSIRISLLVAIRQKNFCPVNNLWLWVHQILAWRYIQCTVVWPLNLCQQLTTHSAFSCHIQCTTATVITSPKCTIEDIHAFIWGKRVTVTVTYYNSWSSQIKRCLSSTVKVFDYLYQETMQISQFFLMSSVQAKWSRLHVEIAPPTLHQNLWVWLLLG